jgi:S-formylglutathione hydrolase FrmB
MKPIAWLGAALLLLTAGPAAPAARIHLFDPLDRVNRQIAGHVIDYTHNHGADRRIWSSALQQKRDLYVYIPPGYDPAKQYPVIIWLHGFAQDEQSFISYLVKPLDAEIRCGKLPPAIIAAPDGSLTGEPCLRTAGSFFINSKAGAYEDFIMQDIWPFLQKNYPIRPEREAHVLAGVSMGGGAAFNLGIKHRDQFKVVLGIFPPVNLRWVDCHGRYQKNFKPDCWGWRTDFTRLHAPVARFYLVFTIRLKDVIGPIFDIGPNTAYEVAQENPIEMIDRLNLQEGELAMFIGYGRFDQFNIDAQVESFLYRAKERGLTVDTAYDPWGRHDVRTAMKLFPDAINWLAEQLAAYGCCAPKAAVAK